jgi:hypothetical protein
MDNCNLVDLNKESISEEELPNKVKCFCNNFSKKKSNYNKELVFSPIQEKPRKSSQKLLS